MKKLQNNNIATPPQVPPQVKSHLYTEVGSIIGYDGGYAYLQIWKSRFIFARHKIAWWPYGYSGVQGGLVDLL